MKENKATDITHLHTKLKKIKFIVSKQTKILKLYYDNVSTARL